MESEPEFPPPGTVESNPLQAERTAQREKLTATIIEVLARRGIFAFVWKGEHLPLVQAPPDVRLIQ